MKSVFGFSVKDICEIAILCAVAIVLDRFIRIGVGSSGGSINISMVPLYVIALRHGWFKSLIAGGVVYGLITCIFDGYGIVCYPLEYFVAYGSVCILGFFAKKINTLLNSSNKKDFILSYGILIGCVIAATTIRFLCASIDSVILWEYTWGAAFIYNASYVYISGIGVCVLMCLLLISVRNTNKAYPTSFLKS